MLTIQPHESLNHLSSQVGQLMQHYQMYTNLLGLRATELKVITRDGKALDQENGGIKLKLDFAINNDDISEDEDRFLSQPISKYLKDGDEFLFKLTSFDQWISIVIHFTLADSDISFSAKAEMRVAGYFQNSHFFALITKLIINIWNENIEDIANKEDYYVLKNINFRNKKLIQEFIDNGKSEANIFEIESPNNRFMKVMTEIKAEIKSVNITKKNYIEVPIDPNAKVEETFGYDGQLLVDVEF